MAKSQPTPRARAKTPAAKKTGLSPPRRPAAIAPPPAAPPAKAPARAQPATSADATTRPRAAKPGARDTGKRPAAKAGATRGASGKDGKAAKPAKRHAWWKKTPVVAKPLKLTAADTTAAVDAYFKSLVHPHADALQRLRRVILAADRTVAEGIKWNAPSFRTAEYFATVNPRATDGVQLILHLGAKARTLPKTGLRIHDPKAMLEWLGRDRASVRFADRADVEAKATVFTALLREWLRYV